MSDVSTIMVTSPHGESITQLWIFFHLKTKKMELGQGIKSIRQRYRYTQKEFAAVLGLSQTWLSQVESGKCNPGMSTLTKISTLLDIPIPILFLFSMDKEDIKYEKQDNFVILRPILFALLQQLT